MKRTPLTRRAKRVAATPHLRTAQEEFKRVVCAAGECVMCRHHPPILRGGLQPDLRTIEAAHLIKRQALEREGADPWDPRIGLALCAYHHRRHDAYAGRLPAHLYPAGAFLYAAEHGLSWLLDRQISPTVARATATVR